MTDSPYDVLDVPRSASGEEIRRAYRRLAFAWHPDRRPADPDATRRFQEMNAAYAAIRENPPPAPSPETLLWRIARPGEEIVVTSVALRHSYGGSALSVPFNEIRRVDMRRGLRWKGTVVVRTASQLYAIELPLNLARRLSTLLIERTG